MSAGNKFTHPDGLTRDRVDGLQLDEIEKSALARAYLQTVEELKREPKNFKNFNALKNAEYAAFLLADDYAEKFKKGLVSRNEELMGVVDLFVNKTEHHNTIDRFGKDPSLLRNNFFLKSLIEVAEDCVNLSYRLAKHRFQTRQNADFETIKASNARLEQISSLTRNCTFRIKEETAEIKSENAEIKETLATISRNLANVLESIESNKQEAAARPNVQQDNAPLDVHFQFPAAAPEVQFGIAAAAAPEEIPNNNDPLPSRPLWMVPHSECADLFQLHDEKEYLVKLCSIAEIFMPIKELPEEKKHEFMNVYKFFNPTKGDWEIKFNKHIKSLNTKNRQKLYKQLGNSRGYGVTNHGFEFYYKVPISRNMECFNYFNCNPLSRIDARPLGDLQIPADCGNDFDFVLMVEKNGSRAKFTKVFPDGTSRLLRNK